MAIEIRQADGMFRWGCTQCDSELNQHGEWLRRSTENYQQILADEHAHFEQWHVPAFLRAHSERLTSER